MLDGSDARWSPDGTKIAYTGQYQGATGSCPKLSCSGVWVMAVDSGDTSYVTSGRSPAWSPDGTRLVLSDLTIACSSTYDPMSGCDGPLYSVGVDGNGRASLGLTGSVPQFSPNGVLIVYQTGQGTDADIHVANSDGTSDRVVVGGPEDDNEPAWSGVGNGLLFHVGTENSLGSQSIQSCDESGGSRQPIVTSGAYPAIGWVLVPD